MPKIWLSLPRLIRQRFAALRHVACGIGNVAGQDRESVVQGGNHLPRGERQRVLRNVSLCQGGVREASGGGEITIIRPYGNGGHPPCETSAVVALAERHRGSGFVYEDTLSYRQFSVPHTRPVPKRRKEFTIIYCNTINTYNISETQNVFRIHYNISLQ